MVRDKETGELWECFTVGSPNVPAWVGRIRQEAPNVYYGAGGATYKAGDRILRKKEENGWYTNTTIKKEKFSELYEEIDE